MILTLKQAEELIDRIIVECMGSLLEPEPRAIITPILELLYDRTGEFDSKLLRLWLNCGLTKSLQQILEEKPEGWEDLFSYLILIGL